MTIDDAHYESGVHAVGIVLQAVHGLEVSSMFVLDALEHADEWCADEADQICDMICGQGLMAHRLVVRPRIIQHLLVACWKQRQLVVFQVRSVDNPYERRWAVLEGVQEGSVKYVVCLVDDDPFQSEPHTDKSATGEAVIVDYRLGKTPLIVARGERLMGKSSEG